MLKTGLFNMFLTFELVPVTVFENCVIHAGSKAQQNW